jgi:BirA family transcriptional regulator, biotin operon repressor / biotin---[acetyl-CoA-carboxylase] ligase
VTISDQTPPLWSIIRLDQVTSTMDEAAEIAKQGGPAGTVVLAEHQTNGRGQRGHVWLEPPGTCLLMTIVLRPPFAVATDPDLPRRIAERVGYAVARITGLVAVVKEPNDLLVNGRKLCGILCQASIRGDIADYLLVGIGLNVNVAPDELPLSTATSLLVETGRCHDRQALLMAILEDLQTIPFLHDEVQPRASR